MRFGGLAVCACVAASPIWVIGCSARSDSSPAASASLPPEVTDARAPEASVADASTTDCSGPSDPSTFGFRSSCVYGIGSDASTLSGCDEWWQSADGDWGPFIVGCTNDKGAVSSQRCVSGARVGTCSFAPTCDSHRVTYFFGEAGVPSFQHTCAAATGATWSSP